MRGVIARQTTLFSVRIQRTVAAAMALAALALSAVLAVDARGAVIDRSAAGAASVPGPYFSAPFRVYQNAHTFGQTPTWTRGGDVLSQEDDKSGILQVYRSRLNGSRMHCLTCGVVPGPNGFAAERPRGGWILFCSYGDQPEHFGNPCLGVSLGFEGADPRRETVRDADFDPE